MEAPSDAGQPTTAAFHLQAGEITQALRGHAFLSGLQESQIAVLRRIVQPVEFREQELVLEAKQLPRDFYLLLSGSASIELNQGNFAVRIQSLEPGDAFGWSALLEYHDSLFDVRTMERCTALRLDGASLAAALREDPVLAAEFLRRTLHLVASRMDATEMRLAEFCGVRLRTEEEQASVESTLRTLNRLIEICLDGELGYRTAAQHLQDSKLQSVMAEQAVQRAHYAEELRAEVRRLGGTPRHSGSLSASLHRGWIALKSAILAGNAKTIIAACETGEDAACLSYESAATSNLLLSKTGSIVGPQWRRIEQSREWLRDVHKALASGSKFPELSDA